MPEMLNRKKPYGEVFGAACPWRYEQDGKKFRANGEIYIEPGEADPEPELTPLQELTSGRLTEAAEAARHEPPKPPIPARRPVGRPPNKKSEWEDPE